MAADRTVSVVVQAKVDQYMASMKKASAATTQLDSQVTAAQKKQSAGWSNVAAGASVAGAGLAILAKKSIDAASDLQEVQSKVQVVFGASAQAVQAWSQTSASAMGISQRAALEAAGSYGNLFRAMGLSSQKSAEMSTGLVQLAADLASFNNTSTEDALGALQSGLAGETEGLKRYGVNLTEATIKQQAMTMGLAKTTGALDPAAKAQAIYALIMKDTALAQGDFARTSDGLANQQRILAAEVENLQASLGESLLPVMQSVVSGATTFAEAINKVPGPIKTAVFAVAAMSAGLLILLPRIAATKAAMTQLGLASAGSAAGMGKFAGAAKGVGVAGVALSVGLPMVGGLVDKIGDSMFGVVPSAEAMRASLLGIANGADPNKLGMFGDKLKGIGQEIEHLDNPGVSQRIEDFFGSLAGQGGGEGRNRVLENISAIDQALADMVAGGQAEQAAAAVEKIKAEVVASGGNADSVAPLLTKYSDALKGVSNSATEAAAGTQTIAEAAAQAFDPVAELQKAADNLKTSLDALGGKQMDVDAALSGLYESFDSAAEAAKKFKDAANDANTNLDLQSSSGRAAQKELENIANAADVAAEAQDRAGASTKDITAKQELARAEFIKTAQAAGVTAPGAAERLADAYGLIPDKVATDIELKRAAEAKTQAEQVRRSIGLIPPESRTSYLSPGAQQAIDFARRVRGAVLNIPEYRTVTVRVVDQNGNTRNLPNPADPRGATGGLFTGSSFRYANGGYIPFGPGMGGPTDDRVPALLSAGEFVLNAKAVARYGLPTLFAMNARRFSTGGAVAKALEKLNTAKEALKSARSTRASNINSMAGSVAGNIGSFNTGANAQALENVAKATADLAESEKKLAAARQAAKNTNSPEAIAALVEAQQQQAAAARAAAAANAEEASTRVNSTNIIADMKKRAAALEDFKKQMAKLKAMGLDQSLLTELANAGVENGGAQAAALAAGGASAITQANAAQKRIQNASRGIAGVGVSNAEVSAAEAAVAAAQVRYNNALGVSTRVGRSGSEYTLNITGDGPPIVIRLDSKEIQQGLLRLKRTGGGLALGLA